MTSSKIRRLNAHMKAAHAYAELSHAKRLQVGAILIKEDRIISVGYNGMPSGGTNECENIVGYVKDMAHTPLLETKPGLVHAEMNAIAFAAKNGVATNGCTMVVTHSPCFECSKLIVQSGITDIYYKEEYRLTESLDFLREYNVNVEKVKDEE